MFWQFTVLLFCLWFRFVCCWGNLFGWKIWNVVVLQCFHFHKCVSFEDINCISLPGLPIFRGEHLSLHPRSHLVPFGASRVWRCQLAYIAVWGQWSWQRAGASQSIPRHALFAASLAWCTSFAQSCTFMYRNGHSHFLYMLLPFSVCFSHLSWTTLLTHT